MGIKKLKCKNCGDEIESEHRHDFTGCSCGDIAVDGGDAYFRMVHSKDAEWEVLRDDSDEKGVF
jgi:hypothetical protein